ncbi:MAG: gliding motility lipoprotein GldH [Bacteroidetes bacterium]|nr:gliding motility lipoprotein GldH [Bacteroidota bacterium]
MITFLKTQSRFVSCSFGVLIMSLFLISCEKELLFETYAPIADKSWSADKPLEFAVKVLSDSNTYNIYLNIRNSHDYKFSNLYLFLETTLPNGNSDMDTIECELADSHGRWLGSGLGDLHDNRILFAENVRFKYKGTYKFKFTQGMRINPLYGISDFGMRIEKNK